MSPRRSTVTSTNSPAKTSMSPGVISRNSVCVATAASETLNARANEICLGENTVYRQQPTTRPSKTYDNRINKLRSTARSTSDFDNRTAARFSIAFMMCGGISRPLCRASMKFRTALLISGSDSSIARAAYSPVTFLNHGRTSFQAIHAAEVRTTMPSRMALVVLPNPPGMTQ